LPEVRACRVRARAARNWQLAAFTAFRSRMNRHGVTLTGGPGTLQLTTYKSARMQVSGCYASLIA
jgi:hypothetical protein